MEVYDIIKSKIDRLISIRLTDGVQPEDLSNNIFLNSYKKISFYKLNKNIIGELVFEEKRDNNYIDVVLRYVYSESKRLLRIEEVTNNNVEINWDRNIIEEELINDIVNIMKKYYSGQQMKAFILSLPEDLKIKITTAYYSAA